MNITQRNLLIAAVAAATLYTLPAAFSHCGACGETDDHSEKSEKKNYPLTTCVVSGRKLGSMGDPYVHHTEEGEEVRFCCKGCLPAFKKSPEKYLEKIKAAEAKPEAEGGKSGGKEADPEGHSH